MNVIVGAADMKVSNCPTDILATYSLGSSLGIAVYDPRCKVGGLIHCMLPSSTIDPEKAKAKPPMFTDTGMTDLLQKIGEKGADRRGLLVKVVGASKLLNLTGALRIGERNYEALRKILAKNGLQIAGEDIGGTVTRNLFLDIGTGRTILQCCGRQMEL